MRRQLRRRDGRLEARPSRIRPLAVLLASAAMLVVLPQAASGKLEPKTISPADVAASSPTVASDGAGNVVAVWRELADDKASIQGRLALARRRVELLGADLGRRCRHGGAELAMDRLGNAVAVCTARADATASSRRLSGRRAVPGAFLKTCPRQASSPSTRTSLSRPAGRSSSGRRCATSARWFAPPPERSRARGLNRRRPPTRSATRTRLRWLWTTRGTPSRPGNGGTGRTASSRRRCDRPPGPGGCPRPSRAPAETRLGRGWRWTPRAPRWSAGFASTGPGLRGRSPTDGPADNGSRRTACRSGAAGHTCSSSR